MTILPVRVFGDPVLFTASQAVTTFDKKLEKLVQDMFDTMQNVGGVGLAASQVGVGLQVFTYLVDNVSGYLINPSLEVGGDLESNIEGCLSVPDLRFATVRSSWAKVTGVDLLGNVLVVEGEGLLARVFQHEFDHLQGMLYVSRLSGESKVSALRSLRSGSWLGSAQETVSGRLRSVNSSFGVIK